MNSALKQDLPFAWGWIGMDLGPARPCENLYCTFPYEGLPPIPELPGTLDWLGPVDLQYCGEPTARADAEACEQLARIVQEAAQLGLTLPPAYVRFMGSHERQYRVPEYAGSWFPPIEHVVPCLGSEHGSLISFLNDQQNAVIWFLYLTPDGKELVIGSEEGDIDATMWEESDDGAGPNAEELATVIANATICAPSFETFIYRFWLESGLYRKLHGYDDMPLTGEEQRYLAHYEPTTSQSEA